MAFNFPIHELGDSPKETLGRDGIKIVRKFLIPWANRMDFAIGMTVVSTGYGLGPAPYPPFPFARVESIDMQPFVERPVQQTITDPVTQLNSFAGNNTCLCTIHYSTQQPQTSDPKEDGLPEGTWATYSQRFSGEFMTLPGRGLTWPSDGKPVGQDAHATILIPLAEHVVTWNRVLNPPWDAISALRGQINETDFRIPGSNGQIREAKTLLFEGCEVGTEYRYDQADQVWNLTYTIKERRVKAVNGSETEIIGWNHLYREDAGVWEEPITFLTGKKLHLTGDFTRLFQFQV